MAQPQFQPPQPPAPSCYRHPGRVTYIGCQRCGRPICPECMTTAPVGFQCPDCVAEGMRSTRQNRGPYGGLRSKAPALTSIILVALNVAVWLGITLTGGSYSQLVWWLALHGYGACTLNGIDAASCATTAYWAPGVTEGAFWQLLTSAFTHLDVLHIGFNMLALWFLGPQLEQVVGRARFLALYLLSALAGSAAVLWLADPYTVTLGASGAVFGLMGALLVLVIKVRGNVQSILIWLGINAAYTFLGPGISWQGHLGGLIGGAAIAAILAYAPKSDRVRVQVIGLVGLGVVVLVLAAVRILQLA